MILSDDLLSLKSVGLVLQIIFQASVTLPFKPGYLVWLTKFKNQF